MRVCTLQIRNLEVRREYKGVIVSRHFLVCKYKCDCKTKADKPAFCTFSMLTTIASMNGD